MAPGDRGRWTVCNFSPGNIGNAAANDDIFSPIYDPGGCRISSTDGFFAGEMNLAYEYTGNEKYKLAALNQVDILKDRIEKKFAVDHHDMGPCFSFHLSPYFHQYPSSTKPKTTP